MADKSSKSNMRTVVNVSLTTDTRQMALTIDGVLTPFTELSLNKFIDFDGNEVLRFSYTVENLNANGMKEIREFFLPSPEDIVQASAKLNSNGLVSRIAHNDEKAKADVINFLKKDW